MALKIDKIAQLIAKGKEKLAQQEIQTALQIKCDAQEIMEKGIMKAMVVVGDRFARGEIYIPELLIASRTTKKCMEILKPYLPPQRLGKMIIATVAGDLHDIGKNLVAVMIEGSGFEVLDLGVDVSTKQIVACYLENPDVNLICLSSLLTTTIESMQETVAALNKAEFRDQIKIMVGGAPVTQELASAMGADGFSEDAVSAMTLAKQLVENI